MPSHSAQSRRKAGSALSTARRADHHARIAVQRIFLRRLMLAVSSSATDVPVAALLQPSRGPKAVAAARMFGMAMLATRFDHSFSAAGHVFRRDRTTARHARDLFIAAPDSLALRAGAAHLEPAMRIWLEAMVALACPDADYASTPKVPG